MAALTYLASTALMLLLLLAVAVAVVRGRHWRGYRPTLGREGGTFERLEALAGNPVVWVVAFLAAGLAVGGAAVMFLGGSLVGEATLPASAQAAAGAVVAAVVAIALTLYLFYGTYQLARSHGLQRAAAVMVGSWALGLLAVVGIAVKLLAG